MNSKVVNIVNIHDQNLGFSPREVYQEASPPKIPNHVLKLGGFVESGKKWKTSYDLTYNLQELAIVVVGSSGSRPGLKC